MRRKRESPIRVPQRQSGFHPRAQRNAFRRDARQQSRLFAAVKTQMPTWEPAGNLRG